MNPITILIPEETDLIEAAVQASAAGLHLICNGRRTVLSPIVPPGWAKVSVQRLRHPHHTQENPPCAA